MVRIVILELKNAQSGNSYIIQQSKDSGYTSFKITPDCIQAVRPFGKTHLPDTNYIWISNKFMIHIICQDVSLPPDLYADYRRLYPQTGKFDDKILNPEVMIRTEMDQIMKKIWVLDDDRNSLGRHISKDKAYMAIGDQCANEGTLRCMIGTGNKANSCPVTMISSDSDRREGWKQLEKDIKTKPVDPSRVNWAQMEHNACGYGSNYATKWARKELEIE